MAKIKARVRANNSYRTDTDHVAHEGDVIEVEASELKVAPHCLIALEEYEAEVKAFKQSANDAAEARNAIFNTAREAAIEAAKAQAEAFALTHAQRAAAGNRAAEKAAEVSAKLAAEAPLKIRTPKSDKRPE